MGRFMRVVAGVGAISAATVCVRAEDWPAWRGDGSGVSPETGLPVHWGPDKNVRWKVRIEGDGISSPIVWGDRVFVTTAVKQKATRASRWGVPGAGMGLVFLALAFVAASRFHRAGPPESETPEPMRLHFARVLDLAVSMVASLAFAVGMAVALFATERVFGSGRVSREWLITGGIGMFGLVAMVGWLDARSEWRLMGAALLLAAAAFFYLAAPLDMYQLPISVVRRLAISGSLTLAAAWSGLLFLTLRRRPAVVASARRPILLRVAGPVAFLGAVVLLFGFINYSRSQRGLSRSVVCLDRDTGTVLWNRIGFVAPAGKKHFANSYATPTPVTDGKYVVAYFGPGIVCMDYEGHVQWREMVPAFSRNTRYGAGSSPVMWDHKIIYAYLAEWPGGDDVDTTYAEESYLAGLDTASGARLWKTTPAGAHDCYDTPLVVDRGGRTAVLFATEEHLGAYHPDSGAELWSCRVPIQQIVPSIVVDDTAAYVLGGTHGLKAAVAVTLGGQGDVSDRNFIWKVKRGIPACTSPVLYEGLLYWIKENGIATCVDAQTGKSVWKKRIGGNYLASPVAGDGRVYFLSEAGDSTVIQAGREYKELARNRLGEECRASPAISGGRLFIRGLRHLYCIEKSGG